MGVATAKSNSFILAAADVQIGAAADLFSLTDTESIGLVKNFNLTAEPTYTELKAGIKNTTVASAMTDQNIRATMEVYEASASNIKWGLGLDGSQGIEDLSAKTYNPAASITSADTTFKIATDVTTDMATGDWVIIIEGGTFHVAKIASSAYSAPDTTVTLTGYAFPADFTVAAEVKRMNAITVGDKTDQPYLSSKVLGVLDSGEEIIVMFPKLRIVRGFTLAFTTDGFGNMPFEFTPYQMIATDPHWGKFDSNDGVCFVLKN